MLKALSDAHPRSAASDPTPHVPAAQRTLREQHAQPTRWQLRLPEVRPGISVASNLAHMEQGTLSMDQLRAMGLIDENKTPQQAAATIVFGAASPLLDGIGGVYLKTATSHPWTPPPGEAPPWVRSRSSPPTPPRTPSTQRLWELSVAML
ncbi:hypothetical protein Ahu01nite_015170 [Winogradskya humida]|uniref:Uncharacterized protein n=1 Tax=Winogradskya humida TaxID=113566 RepID=A0ABQ3ZIJ4_9ACTN|nr:hypothetical protein Ahu01nite_015170 [Actinoplanes humidus]